jgi:hypothetical protein
MSSRRPGVEFCILHSALVPGHRRDRSSGARRPISVTRSVSHDRRHPSAGRECTSGDLGSCPPRRDNMDTQLLVICGLTFVIHVIVTLAYAVRIAGVRTRRIAVSFSLFGIIALVSRTANSFQGKRVELDIAHHTERGLLGDFRLFLLTATVASAVGAFLIPTFQRYFSHAVDHFQVNRSIPRLLLRGRQLHSAWCSAPVPAQRHPTGNWRRRFLQSHRPDVIAMAIWTVGLFASLYAGYLKPDLRVTCANLSSVINGLATVVLAGVIDPQVSVITDDVIEVRISENTFRRAITTP